MNNYKDQIIKNQIKLTIRDLKEEINKSPEKAIEILDNYNKNGIVEAIDNLIDSL